MFRPNALKQALLAGRPVFGATHTLANAATAELLGLAGCDFVLIDDEHGQGDRREHLGCLQALAGTRAHAIVRLADASPTRIKHMLDIGAEGLMCPNMASGDAARAFVAACRYPPRGTRGYAAPGVRASDYGFQNADYMSGVERELLLCAMIESAAGVERAEAIAATDGVDLIQIGANDLAHDMGLSGDVAHPEVTAAIARVERATLAAGKLLGGAPLPGVDVAALVRRDYRLITIGRDAGLLATALRQTLDAARAAIA